ncbi:MAG: DUF2958 domain-containing protein [Chloracidobacterium sp.]|nr:DUF2958 domain-containing protein [Chloracidobacterium sp.]
MKELLSEELKARLPKLYEQEGAIDPIVHAKFSFPASCWLWFVTEGQTTGSDFTFFGYVIGFEAEWGYFTLGELEQVNVNGFTIERDDDFEPQTLSTCLSGSI